MHGRVFALTNRFKAWTCSLWNTYTSRFELFRECHGASGRKSASAGKNEAFLVRRSPDDGSRKTVCRAHVASGAPDSPAC